MNGYKSKVANHEPIITQRGIHRSPRRSVFQGRAVPAHAGERHLNGRTQQVVGRTVAVRDVYQHFKYQNIMTEDLVAFFNKQARA